MALVCPSGVESQRVRKSAALIRAQTGPTPSVTASSPGPDGNLLPGLCALPVVVFNWPSGESWI